jgi:hypothetical protein
MSAWRRIAHERFPQLKTEIDKAANPAELWQELKREFDVAYTYDESAKIQVIHDYALWMIETTHSADLAQAAVDGLYRPLIEQSWMADDYDLRRPALEMPQYLGDDSLTALYWDHLHAIMPAGKQRDFIAELGIGKPPRRG